MQNCFHGAACCLEELDGWIHPGSEWEWPPAIGYDLGGVTCPEASGLLHPLVWATLLQRLPGQMSWDTVTLYSVGNFWKRIEHAKMMDKRQGDRRKRTEDPPGQGWPLCRRWWGRCAVDPSASPKNSTLTSWWVSHRRGLIAHSVKGMGECPGHQSWPCPFCDYVPLLHSIRTGHHGMESSYH